MSLIENKKEWLITTFCLEISDYVDDEPLDVMGRILTVFVATNYLSEEEAKRIEADCKALLGNGITYTDEGKTYS